MLLRLFLFSFLVRYATLICFKRLRICDALSSFVHFNVICMLNAQLKLHDKMSFQLHTKSQTVTQHKPVEPGDDYGL